MVCQTSDIGLGDIEFMTCNYCMNYLLRLLQYCTQKIEAEPHSLEVSMSACFHWEVV